ncbi:hypothetical protein K502DRAFT_315133 [Neoconidiobolus thromboides FSU 785]|nr:hypothetical protein K502DRAFT_315133 [Neoconidiobolus thromboides FSU 785]
MSEFNNNPWNEEESLELESQDEIRVEIEDEKDNIFNESNTQVVDGGDITRALPLTFKKNKLENRRKNSLLTNNRFRIPSLEVNISNEGEILNDNNNVSGKDSNVTPTISRQQSSSGNNNGIGNLSIPSTPQNVDDFWFDYKQFEERESRLRVYDDFNAIDWNFDFEKERIRKEKIIQKKGFFNFLFIWWDASIAWIIVLFIGVTCGVFAAFIDIISDWLADIRIGYCSTGFYINQSFCCWGYDSYNDCDEWVPWYLLFRIESYSVNYLIQYLIFLFSGTLFATSCAFLVYKFAPYASRSGLPEIKTILAGFIIRGFLGKWTLMIKTIGSCLAVASGLTLGKEAPLVHIACCIGNFYLRFFNKYRFNEAKKREILSAAASAGISVAFGTPIGGVLYSLEEVSYYFPYKIMWRSFFCAMMAAVTLKAINPFRTGNLVHFQVAYTTNWHGFEMIFFLLLGAIGGLLGALFIRLNLKVTSYIHSSWLAKYPIQQVFSIALITAAISYPNIYMRVDASELLSNLFKECDTEPGLYPGLCDKSGLPMTMTLLTIAGLLKFFLAIFTFGLEIPAGFYMPSMMIGACLGRVMGILVDMWQRSYPTLFLFSSCGGKPCISPGTYAMVGAAAMMGGMTRMTVSLVIIMFELTGALTYALPIMMAVMTSKWVGDAFGPGGLTHGLINLYGYPYLDNKEEYQHDYTAGNVMTRIEDLVTIPANGPNIETLNELLSYSNFKGFPIIKSNSDTTLVGYISRSELRTALEQGVQQPGIDGNSPCLFDIIDAHSLTILESNNFLDIRSWTDHTPITVSLTLPMELVISLFSNMGLRYVLVTKYGKLLGLITKKDVLRHLSFVNHSELSNHNFNSSRSEIGLDEIPLISRNNQLSIAR